MHLTACLDSWNGCRAQVEYNYEGVRMEVGGGEES